MFNAGEIPKLNAGLVWFNMVSSGLIWVKMGVFLRSLLVGG